MCLHGIHHRFACRQRLLPSRLHVDVDIERVELKHIVMRWSCRRCSGATVVRATHTELTHRCAATTTASRRGHTRDRERGALRQPFGKRCDRTRNPPHHPMHSVRRAVAGHGVGVVHEQHVAHNRIRLATPRQCRRHIASGLRMLLRDHPAIAERRGGQRHDPNRATSTTATTAGGSRWRLPLQTCCGTQHQCRQRHHTTCHNRHSPCHCWIPHLNDDGWTFRQAS